MSKAEYRYYELPQDLPLLVLTGEKWEYLFMDTEMILKKIFSDAPEKYIQIQKNLSEEVFILDNSVNAEAANLLQMIIEEAARSVGYPVLSTFLRNFRKITGLSPSAWRKKALQNPQNITAYQISVLKGW